MKSNYGTKRVEMNKAQDIVFKLRKSGKTIKDIAKNSGVSQAAICRIIEFPYGKQISVRKETFDKLKWYHKGTSSFEKINDMKKKAKKTELLFVSNELKEGVKWTGIMGGKGDSHESLCRKQDNSLHKVIVLLSLVSIVLLTAIYFK